MVLPNRGFAATMPLYSDSEGLEKKSAERLQAKRRTVLWLTKLRAALIRGSMSALGQTEKRSLRAIVVCSSLNN